MIPMVVLVVVVDFNFLFFMKKDCKNCKKEASVKSKKIRINKKFFYIFPVLVMVILIPLGFNFFKEDSKVEDVVEISLDEVSMEARWYDFETKEGVVSFFAVEDTGGNVKTAFDSCDVCYYSEEGYSQDGKHMVCDNCGNRYPISGLGTENKTEGGCWPGYLPSTIEKEKVIIEKDNLEENSWRAI